VPESFSGEPARYRCPTLPESGFTENFDLPLPIEFRMANKTTQIDPTLAGQIESAEPVLGFPIQFSWHKNYWSELFDCQVELIRNDIRRARVEEKLIIYLSCPISARGGGDESTNVEIAKATERRLLARWGERFWILNPTQYQMESKEGTGLMGQHASTLGYDLAELRSLTPNDPISGRPAPFGGDYMRMWTKVLVEDRVDPPYHFTSQGSGDALKNTAQHFDAFYFLGPSDVAAYFAASGGQTLTAAIEAHFARKFITDPDFCDSYSIAGIDWRRGWRDDIGLSDQAKQNQTDLRLKWGDLRRQYVRFYGLRASANFSLGSHDEWNILRQINRLRRQAVRPNGKGDNIGIPEQLPGFFDGIQIDPGASEAELSRGYATSGNL